MPVLSSGLVVHARARTASHHDTVTLIWFNRDQRLTRVSLARVAATLTFEAHVIVPVDMPVHIHQCRLKGCNQLCSFSPNKTAQRGLQRVRRHMSAVSVLCIALGWSMRTYQHVIVWLYVHCLTAHVARAQ